MSNAGDMLTYSDCALANRSLLFSGYNSINIYVEDVGKQYIYEHILERLFANKLRIRTVFPLGGKNAVLAKCRAAGPHKTDGTPNVFLVDGDFDNLWDDQKETLPGLIYLTRYNIESYYCSNDATVAFLRMNLHLVRSEIEAVLRYEEWEATFFQEAEPLFILFALVKRYLPSKPGVGTSVENFLDMSGHTAAETVENYRQELTGELGDLTPYIDEVEKLILCHFSGNRKEQLQALICGKYETTSLYRYIRETFNIKKLSYTIFQDQLIDQFDLSPLTFLKDFIQQQLRADAPRKGNA